MSEFQRKTVNIERLKEAFRSGQEYLSVSYPRKTETGTYAWVNTWVHVYSNEEEDPCCMIYVQSIDEEIRQREIQMERIKKAIECAEKASWEKTELLENISHGVRIPMNSILGMITLAKGSIDDKDELEQCLDKLTIASNELMAVINHLLKVPQLESEKQILVHNVSEIADENYEQKIFAGKRILVVDDIPINTEIICGFLKDTGVLLEEVYSGQDAISSDMMHKSGYYDVIFMDMRMPDISGLEATKAIRELTDKGNMPIISVSANTYSHDMKKEMKAGITDYLLKPISKDDLIRILKTYL